MLGPGFTPICVLRGSYLPDLKLPAQFLVDLRELLPALSQESISQDLLNGAMARETLTRCLIGDTKTLSHVSAYTMIAAVLLRQNFRVFGKGVRRENYPGRLFRKEERQAVLSLLHHYGVRCATGECCGLAVDPLKLEGAA